MGFLQPGIRKRRRRPCLARHSNVQLPNVPLPYQKISERRKVTPNNRTAIPKVAYQPSLSRLESLPIELLQDIFLLSQNLSLPLASRALSRILTGRFLQVQVIRSACVIPAYFTDILSRRFFTSELLNHMEDRYGPLNLQEVYLPSRLLKAPFAASKIHLLNELLARGAKLDETDMESCEGVKQAVVMRRVDAVQLLLSKVGMKPHPGLLYFGIQAGFPTESLSLLVGPGDLDNSKAWLAAMEASDTGYRISALKKMLELGNPPPQIMSQICTYLLSVETDALDCLGET